MNETENPFSTAVRTICEENLGLLRDELLLVVADLPLKPLGARIAEEAKGFGQACKLVEVGRVKRAGCPPPGFTREILCRGAAALLVTSKSLSHTEERRVACHEHGIRIASMPGITGEVICRLFCPGSAGLVSRRTNALAASLEGAGRIELRTEAGTELELSIAGRKIYTDTGLYREPGRFGNLPAGEVSAAPVSFSARGRVVVDLAFAGLGAVDGLILELEKGRIVAAKGPGRGRLLKLLAENRDRVAGEFGIGTNPLARPSSLTLEAEKAVGTVHLGLGDNISFGGENRATGHWDAVLNCRWIKVDGEILDLTEPLV